MKQIRNKVLVGGMVFGTLVLSVIGGVDSVFGLTYQSDVDVQFTFNPVLTVSVSDDLNISDLAPGTFSDSNAVQVTVSTNNAYGYTLSATVGDTENNFSNELRHSTYASSGDPIFSSIATNADLARATFSSDSTYDNKWGLSTSNDGTTWGNYNGLPVTGGESAMELLSANYTPTNGTASKYVRIGARASSTQYSGTYTNVINFVAVGGVEPEPPIYMQDLTPSTIATLLPSVGSTATVKDKRDQQDYTIAKLADNKYWMIENLNLAGGTAIESTKSDVDASYISSFSTSNNLTKDATNNTIVLPASSTSGFYTDNYSYVYNSGNKTNCGASGQNTRCYSYYSWDAATLGSGRSISTDNTDVPYSICPKGWRLPTSRTTDATNWQTTSDFYQLAHQYGLDSTTSTSESDSGFYDQAGPGTTPNFLLAGYYSSGSFHNGGSGGYYWSATSYSSASDARNLSFRSSNVNSANLSGRFYGFSVRCVFDIP